MRSFALAKPSRVISYKLVVALNHWHQFCINFIALERCIRVDALALEWWVVSIHLRIFLTNVVIIVRVPHQ
jgi:hypothetical protein